MGVVLEKCTSGEHFHTPPRPAGRHILAALSRGNGGTRSKVHCTKLIGENRAKVGE